MLMLLMISVYEITYCGNTQIFRTISAKIQAKEFNVNLDGFIQQQPQKDYQMLLNLPFKEVLVINVVNPIM